MPLKGNIAAFTVRVSGGPWYRIIPSKYAATCFATAPVPSRFRPKDAAFDIFYAAHDFTTAFAETMVRDIFVGRATRRLRLSEIQAKSVVEFEIDPSRPLSLLDLRGDGCLRLGIATDAVRARNHAAGRALGVALHAGYPDTDGILYPSRLTEGDNIALYDRACTDGRRRLLSLEELTTRRDLPAALDRFAVKLIKSALR